jgi:uncharacterized protein
MKAILLIISAVILSSCAGSVTKIAEGVLYPFEDTNKRYKVSETPPEGLSQVYFDVPAADGGRLKIHAWYQKNTNPRARVLVHFHGNGENLEALRQSGLFEAYSNLGLSYIVIDYPGLGRSTGTPNEKNLTTAGVAAVRWARRELPSAPIVVWGRSLGAAVAAQVVKVEEQNISGLVLTSPWANFLDLAKDKSGLASQLPKSWLDQHRYDTEAVVKQFSLSTLIHHGVKDEVVPIKFGRRVFAAFSRGVAKMSELKDFGHNDIYRSQDLWRDIRAFGAN